MRSVSDDRLRFAMPLLHGSVEVDLRLPAGDPRRLWFNVPSNTHLLECVAQGLAGMPRFCNQTRGRVSVAEHSVNLANLLEEKGMSPQLSLAALLHDAPEGLGVADINTFLKYAMCDGVREFEAEMCGVLWGVVKPEDAWASWEHLSRATGPLHQYDQLLGDWEARTHGFPARRENASWTPPTPRVQNFHWSESEATRAWLESWGAATTRLAAM